MCSARPAATGSTTIAQLDGALEATGGDSSVVGEIRKQIDLIKPAWSGVVPPKTVIVDPSQVHGAAARIEIVTLSLKPQQ
jgi:hypothetical protein